MRADIKNGLPVPSSRETRAWPHRDMCVGEYFEVDTRKVKPQVLYVANYRWGKKLGRKFICRSEGQILRVWRIA